MAACRNSRTGFRCGLAAILALSCILFGAPALGQSSSGPIKLYKPSDEEEVKKSSAPEPGKGAGKNAPGVAVEKLQKVDLSAVGSIGPAEGGLRADMWRGTRRDLIEALIPQLPVKPGARSLRSLQRRLLLSAGAVPAGRRRGPSLLALRIEKLAESGWYDDLVSLVRHVPVELADGTLARIQRDSYFLLGNNADACKVAERFAGRDPAADWQKAMAFCAAIQGESERVDLILDLLRDQGIKDAMFYALIDEMQHGEKARLKSTNSEEALHLALLRATNRPIYPPAKPRRKRKGGKKQSAQDKLPSDPALLRAIAMSEGQDFARRVEAGVKAHSWGALSARDLRLLLSQVQFDEAARADIPSYAKNHPDAMVRALHYQLAALESDPDQRARHLMTAYGHGQAVGARAEVIELNAPTSNRLQPAPSLRWFAPIAVRADLVGGDMVRAKAWYGLLRADANQRGQARSLAPLMYIAGVRFGQAGTSAILGQWWLGEAAKGDRERYRRAEYLVSMFRALGHRVPPTLWYALLEAPPLSRMPEISPGLKHALAQAAGANRLGETVLVSLVAIGELAPDQLGAESLRAIVYALARVGLRDDARALAIDALMKLEF